VIFQFRLDFLHQESLVLDVDRTLLGRVGQHYVLHIGNKVLVHELVFEGSLLFLLQESL